MLLKRLSGPANRAADLRIDAVARSAAAAVRAANRDGATERFLARFLDNLHDFDNEARGLAPLEYNPLSAPRRRGRPRSG